MATAKKPVVVDKAAVAKRRAAAKVEKAKKPVVLQTGQRLTREEAGRRAAAQKTKPKL